MDLLHGIRSNTRWRGWDTSRLSLMICVVLGLVFGLAQAIGAIAKPTDTDLYWRTTEFADFADLYAPNWSIPPMAYVYPPPMAQILAPLHVIPFPVIVLIWSVICFASAWYVAREWAVPALAIGMVGLAIPVLRPFGVVLSAAVLGNIQLPLAASIVFAVRHPAAWAIPLLSKTTCGVGVLWYAFRGEWRPFAIATSTTLAVATVSFILAPSLWAEFTAFMVASLGLDTAVPSVGPSLVVRTAAAIGLVGWGARTNRIWTVPVAAGIALPGLYGWLWPTPFFLAVIGLQAEERRDAARPMSLRWPRALDGEGRPA